MSGMAPDRDTWLTPPYLIHGLGEFDLDPCCPPDMPWATATKMLTLRENGLLTPWSGRVWLNPPYSDMQDWVARLAQHGNGIALLFSRTDTAAFHDHVFPIASGLLFLRRRLRFFRPDGRQSFETPPAPSVLIAYDPPGSITNADALCHCGLPGFYVPLDVKASVEPSAGEPRP